MCRDFIPTKMTCGSITVLVSNEVVLDDFFVAPEDAGVAGPVALSSSPSFLATGATNPVLGAWSMEYSQCYNRISKINYAGLSISCISGLDLTDDDWVDWKCWVGDRSCVQWIDKDCVQFSASTEFSLEITSHHGLW